MSAVAEIVPGRFFVGFWFVGDESGDWFAAMWRDKDGPWRASYRFRYPGQGDGGKDLRRSYSLEAPSQSAADEKKLRDALDMIAALAGCRYRGDAHYVPVQSDIPEIVGGKLAEQSWASFAGMSSGGAA